MWKNWKCDVTWSLPPSPVTNCHTFSDPPWRVTYFMDGPHGARRVHSHIPFPPGMIQPVSPSCDNIIWQKICPLLGEAPECVRIIHSISISSRNTLRQTMWCKLRFLNITVNAPVGSEAKPKLNHWFCCILKERIIPVWHESGGPGSGWELLAPPVATQLERRRDNMGNELIPG